MINMYAAPCSRAAPARLCRAMVLAQRLRLLSQMAARGHIVWFSLSWSDGTRRCRAKFTVQDVPDAIPAALRQPMVEYIRALSDLLPLYTVVDRGHVFSSGQAWACFWLEEKPHQGRHAAAQRTEIGPSPHGDGDGDH